MKKTVLLLSLFAISLFISAHSLVHEFGFIVDIQNKLLSMAVENKSTSFSTIYTEYRNKNEGNTHLKKLLDAQEAGFQLGASTYALSGSTKKLCAKLKGPDALQKRLKTLKSIGYADDLSVNGINTFLALSKKALLGKAAIQDFEEPFEKIRNELDTEWHDKLHDGKSDEPMALSIVLCQIEYSKHWWDKHIKDTPKESKMPKSKYVAANIITCFNALSDYAIKEQKAKNSCNWETATAVASGAVIQTNLSK